MIPKVIRAGNPPRRCSSLPPELLNVIIAQAIMEAIDMLVYCAHEEFALIWRTRVLPILSTSKQFHAVATRIFCNALDIKYDDSNGACVGRTLGTQVYYMRADAEEVERVVLGWQGEEDSAKLIAPMVYTGAPLRRLYRLSDYGPWYFYTRAARCTTAIALDTLHGSMLQEADEMMASLKFPELKSAIQRRIVRLKRYYSNGYRVMQCAQRLAFLYVSHESKNRPSTMIESLKVEVPFLARIIASITLHMDMSPLVEKDTIRHVLRTLLSMLIVVNDSFIDYSVNYVFMKILTPEIAEMWRDMVDEHITHAQRTRLLREVPSGLVPEILASLELGRS